LEEFSFIVESFVTYITYLTDPHSTSRIVEPRRVSCAGSSFVDSHYHHHHVAPSYHPTPS